MTTKIYFVRPVNERGPVKIGCSTKPLKRLATLMAWSPVDLEIVASAPGGFPLERRIHSLFGPQYLRHEWFAASDALDSLIEGVKAGRAIEDLIDMSAPIVPHRRRRPRTPEERRRMSYTYRLERTFREIPFVEPSDVNAIMARWRGDRLHDVEPIQPTEAEISRLDAVLANPKKHGRRHAKLYLTRAFQDKAAKAPPAKRRRAA